MISNVRRTFSFAGLAVLLAWAGCAMQQREQTANPTAQRVQSQQQQSQAALDRANEAQKRAADQEKRAAQAQENVQKSQRALIQAQQEARREQAKAEQLQQEANALTRQAAQQATQAQQQATQSLAQQGRQVRQGQLTTAGEVVAASGDELVLRPQSGQQTMTFRVTDRTNVRIDGAQASLADIQQGQDARVSYQTTGSLQPEAFTIDVTTGAQPGAPAAAPSGSPGEPK